MSLDSRSDALDKKLSENTIDNAVDILVRDAKKRRRQIIWLAISLMLDLWLTIGLAFLSIQARDTAIEVQKSNNSLISNCKIGNEFRASEAGLWQHILSIQPVNQGQLTPEQEAQREKTVADFQQYLKTTFAPRDCDNIIQK